MTDFLIYLLGSATGITIAATIIYRATYAPKNEDTYENLSDHL